MQVKPTTLKDGVPQQRTCAAAHGAVVWVAVHRRQDLLDAVVVDAGVSVFHCNAGEAIQESCQLQMRTMPRILVTPLPGGRRDLRLEHIELNADSAIATTSPSSC